VQRIRAIWRQKISLKPHCSGIDGPVRTTKATIVRHSAVV